MPSYSPTTDVNKLDPLWGTVLLSLRDVRLGVPVNFNSYPGIALTAACFADKKYTAEKSTCISNVLSLGYSRFVVDVYLDESLKAWGICPDTATQAQDSTVPTPTSSSLITPSVDLSASPLPTLTRARRGKLGSNGSVPALFDNTASSGYVCDDAFNLTALLTVFDAWADSTDTDLAVRLAVLEFNLHKAAGSSGYSSSSGSFSSVLKSVFSHLYSPSALFTDRDNLHSSWLDTNIDEQSIDRMFDFQALGEVGTDYYNVLNAESSQPTTLDGWPNEEFLNFEDRRRFIPTFGTISADLNYDYATLDGDDIFAPGYLGVASSPANKCHYLDSNDNVSANNNSWAIVADSNTSPFSTSNTTTDLSSCGLAITVNSTVNATANSTDSMMHYFNVLRATTAWAWDDGEPATKSANTTRGQNFRCAAMSAANGTWAVADCQASKRPVCRKWHRPYSWVVGNTAVPYAHASSMCPEGTSFDAPRTALENRYLLAAVEAAGVHDAANSRVWMDFNSLAVEKCWVTGGANASCPYDQSTFESRKVLVPTVAAVIILAISALACCAKIGSWRSDRVRRKRRKMVKGAKRRMDGVEYEGVPS